MRYSKDAQANAPRGGARNASASAARSTRTRMPDSLQRRLKAAGLAREDDDDTKPVDIDAVRIKAARTIHMAINTWEGCPEPLCRRERGCMAPNNFCTNALPLPPVSEKDLARTKAEFYRAVKEAAERNEAQAALQEADADKRSRATPRKRRSRGDDTR